MIPILSINLSIKRILKPPVQYRQSTRHVIAFSAIKPFIAKTLALGTRLKLISLVTDAVTV